MPQERRLASPNGQWLDSWHRLGHGAVVHDRDGKDVTNQFLYANLAKLYEQLGNKAEAIRMNEQLLAYFAKMASECDRHDARSRHDEETVEPRSAE